MSWLKYRKEGDFSVRTLTRRERETRLELATLTLARSPAPSGYGPPKLDVLHLCATEANVIHAIW
jgi:hypothetical protein